MLIHGILTAPQGSEKFSATSEKFSATNANIRTAVPHGG